MKGFLKDVKRKSTWNVTLMVMVQEYGKPIQRSELARLLSENGIMVYGPNLGVYLVNAVKAEYLKTIKYPNMHPFYCYPKWVNESGELHGTFDPITKEFNKHEPKTQE